MALTSTGLEIPTLEEIRAEIRAALRSTVSNTLDLDPSAPLGITVDVFSRQTRLAWEALAAVYGAMSPSGGTGASLTRVAALTGTVRRGATFSNVTATLDLDAGTYLAGTLVANVTDRPGSVFSNAEDITLALADAAYDATFVASDTGPVAAPSGSLEISGPVSGWNAITNAADAALGEDIETDATLRARRTQEVQAQGSTTVDAIRADISQNVEGVIQVNVLENVTNVTDANGLAPHSLEAIVFGPASPTAADDQAVADQIFLSKPAGTMTNGTTDVDVVTAQGLVVNVSFSRPSAVAGSVILTVEKDPSTYPGDDEARLAFSELVEASQSVGADLDWSDAVALAMQITGVHRVTAVSVGLSGGEVAFGSLVASIREVISVAFGDITITSTDGEP